MSKNISNLSGRIGLKDNLFKKISENTLNHNSQNSQEIAKQYNMGVSTIHGAESFYEFLRPSHREKKAFVCNGSACMCAGTQEPLKKKLETKINKKIYTWLIFNKVKKEFNGKIDFIVNGVVGGYSKPTQIIDLLTEDVIRKS